MRKLYIEDIILDMEEFLAKYCISFDSNQYITTEEFVTMLIRNSITDFDIEYKDCSIRNKACELGDRNCLIRNKACELEYRNCLLEYKDCISKYMDYALHQGIIEDYDRTMAKSYIERRSVARIIHEVLLKDNELDEKDWSFAESLYDLYSCHTCVMHIAQMYVKGIILNKADQVFDVYGNITGLEAATIIVRMLDKTQRKPLIRERKITETSLTYEEAEILMSKENKVKLIDVRTSEEFKVGHIKKSINIPLQTLTNNPYAIHDNKNIPIILYCTRGYKSKLAAHELIKAGYGKVYTIPGIEEYPYDLII